MNSLHIGVVNVVLTLAENVVKVVGLDLELLIRLVLFETELVVGRESGQLENQQVNSRAVFDVVGDLFH